MVSLCVCIHNCILLVLVCAFFNDIIMLHKNYSHNWIYDVSFSMPVCSHIWLMHFSWHHIAQELLTQLGLWCFIWYARLHLYMVSLSVCIHNCIVLVVVYAFFNDIMLHRNYSHNHHVDMQIEPICAMMHCVWTISLATDWIASVEIWMSSSSSWTRLKLDPANTHFKYLEAVCGHRHAVWDYR